MVQLPVKDKRIAGFQRNGYRIVQRLRGYQSVFISSAVVFSDAPCVRTWENVHAAIFYRGIITRHPKAENVVWLQSKIRVVLVPNLFPAEMRRFHEQLTLMQHDVGAQYGFRNPHHSRMKREISEKFIVPRHAREFPNPEFEGFRYLFTAGDGRFDLYQLIGYVGIKRDNLGNLVPHTFNFLRCEQSFDGKISLFFILFQLLVIDEIVNTHIRSLILLIPFL